MQWAVGNPHRSAMVYFIGTTYSITDNGTEFSSFTSQYELQINLDMTQNPTIMTFKRRHRKHIGLYKLIIDAKVEIYKQSVFQRTKVETKAPV